MRIEDAFTYLVQSFFYDHFFPKTQRGKKIQFFYTCLDLKQAVVLPLYPCNESIPLWG